MTHPSKRRCTYIIMLNYKFVLNSFKANMVPLCRSGYARECGESIERYCSNQAGMGEQSSIYQPECWAITHKPLSGVSVLGFLPVRQRHIFLLPILSNYLLSRFYSREGEIVYIESPIDPIKNARPEGGSYGSEVNMDRPVERTTLLTFGIMAFYNVSHSYGGWQSQDSQSCFRVGQLGQRSNGRLLAGLDWGQYGWIESI